MSEKCHFITFLLLSINYTVDVIETTKVFPLSNDVCKEILQHAEVDVSEINVIRYELDSKSTVSTGQSLFGEVFRLFLDYEKNSQTFGTSFLIISPISSFAYQTMNIHGVFEKEYRMYSKILPEMTKLEGESFNAKFITGDDAKDVKTLVLEDVYGLGYKAGNLNKRLTMDESKLVFEKLAKFHALTVILDKRGLLPKSEEESDEQQMEKNFEKVSSYSDQGMKHFVENLNSEIKEKYADKLDRMKRNALDQAQKAQDEGLQVLVHGNLVPPQILLKHKEDDSVVEDVKFIGFIATKWSSPLLDIFYVAIGSMDFADVDEHLDTLFEVYSKTANDLFEKHQIERRYTLHDMKNDTRKQYMTFMWICGVVLPLISDPQLRCESCAQKDGSFKEPLSEENMATVYGNQNYVDKASKWFMFFVKRGIFDD